jgi:lysophospholipase L1-like esterase
MMRIFLLWCIYDANISPANDDLNAMAAGAVHFNAAGYTVIGAQVYKRLKELEII